MNPAKQPEWVFLHRQLLPASEAKISPLGDGFMFGRAVFETIRMLDGKPVFIREHHRRISDSAQALGIELQSSIDVLRQLSTELAVKNGQSDGVVKLVWFRDRDDGGELIVSRAFPYSEPDYTRGFRLQIERGARASAGPSHKTTNYLNNALSRERARQSGFDEALFAAENGDVLEGAATNFFVVSGGQVLTPPLSKGVLPGIARGQILQHWADRADERLVTTEMLAVADEVFVTNAVLGVMPVSRIDGRSYPVEKYRVTTELRTEFSRWQRESIG